MPYYTNWKKDGIIWKFYGDVTADEIERANNEFYENEGSDFAKYQIIDTLDVKSVEWNDIDIKKIAALDKGASIMINKLRVAYISNDEKVIKILEKYTEISRILNSTWEFRSFAETKPAIEWVKENEP